jgi:hypothetical protein
MAARRAGSKDLRRRTASRPQRKTILIFCEGEASEPDYLNALKRLPEIRSNTAISLVIDRSPGLPLDLVQRQFSVGAAMPRSTSAGASSTSSGRNIIRTWTGRCGSISRRLDGRPGKRIDGAKYTSGTMPAVELHNSPVCTEATTPSFRTTIHRRPCTNYSPQSKGRMPSRTSTGARSVPPRRCRGWRW